jgi:glyoxylase-like metal-dependent hydrolase (beta-lactamase superfamily II)
VSNARNVSYEFDIRPNPGDLTPVADGVEWLRMPLPFSLSHINLWVLRDNGNTAIVDTGINSAKSRDIWQRTLADRELSRVLVTHLHPDHVGCAGWLCAEYEVDLWMPREEYLLCRILVADTGRHAPAAGVKFYRAAGFPEDAIHRYQEMFGMFGKFVAPLPESYRRLRDGQSVSIDDSGWTVIVGRGHSPEHACLFNADRNLLISGDQLLPKISSNVSVYPTEPLADPLREWLESLAAMKARIPADVLVLPAHGSPFRGAHARLDALIDEHMLSLEKLLELCQQPRRAVDVFPALFKAKISDTNLIMATGEATAHLNYLLTEGVLRVDTDAQGVCWYQRA